MSDVRERELEFTVTVARHDITVRATQREIVEENNGTAISLTLNCDEGEYEFEADVSFPDGGVWSDVKIDWGDSNTDLDNYLLYEDMFGLDMDEPEEKPILLQIERYVQSRVEARFVEALRESWDD